MIHEGHEFHEDNHGLLVPALIAERDKRPAIAVPGIEQLNRSTIKAGVNRCLKSCMSVLCVLSVLCGEVGVVFLFS